MKQDNTFDVNKATIEKLRKEISELKHANDGLKWELSDAQYNANTLSERYVRVCEAAAPYMAQIMDAEKGKFTYDDQTNEARFEKPELQEKPHIHMGFPQIFEEAEIKKDQIYPASSSQGESIAVQLHLYYEDLMDEFKAFLNNIPFPFDLYISCREDADVQHICKSFAKLNFVRTVIVRPTQNRGRDIAPMYVLFRKEIAEHDILLHIHSKKTLTSGRELKEWRRGALWELCGSELQVKRIFALFQNEWKKVGLYFPEVYAGLVIMAHTWTSNREWGAKLAKEFGFVFDDTMFNYPAGSFFWARTDAIKPLLDKNYTYEDFEEEAGQTDGTLAHALERSIAKITRSRGYHLAIGDSTDGVVRFDKSHHKLFKPYYDQNLELAKYWLNQFDAVSFDIFDTLIAEKVFDRNNIFEMIQIRLKSEGLDQLDFINLRKEAEEAALVKMGAYMTIHDIYDVFGTIAKVDSSVTERVKQLEIELECELCIPRDDVKELYYYLLRKGKTMYLTCDTYFPADIVKRLLEKCGYTDYDKMYLSCEMGMKKEDATMWKHLRNSEWKDSNLIHVGDDLYSDLHIAGVSKIPSYAVLSGMRLFELSPLYDYFKPFIGKNLSTDLVLGKLIHQYLFNSPYILNNGKLRWAEDKVISNAVLVPVLIAFVQAIEGEVRPEQTLLFTAGAGEFLQRFYEYYYRESGRKLNHTQLLEVTGRAVKLSCIESENDVRDILSQNYIGQLGELLENKLGMIDADGLYDFQVTMPKQTDLIMKMLEPMFADYLAECKLYNKNYRDFIYESLEKAGKEPVVIGLTPDNEMQYYLEKLSGVKIDGFYLYCDDDQKLMSGRGKISAIYKSKEDSAYARRLKAVSVLEYIVQLPQEFLPFHINDLIAGSEDYIFLEKWMKHGCYIDPDIAICLVTTLADTQMLPKEQSGLWSI